MTSIKRCMLIALAVLLSFSGVFAFFSALTFAEEIKKKDYGIKVTGKLELGGSNDAKPNPSKCDYVDFSRYWSNFFNPRKEVKYSAPNIFLSDNAQFVEFAVKFNQEALKGENYDWAVVQTGPWDSAISGDLFRNIRIFLIPKKANLVVKDGYIQSDQHMLFVDVFINPNAGCRLQYWDGSGESFTDYILTAGRLMFLLNHDNITYPGDYEGDIIPQVFDFITKISPQWVLSVDRRRVTGHVQDPNKDDVKRCLTLRIKDKDDNILFERTQDHPGISCAKVLPFTWTAPGLGTYYFETEFFVPIPFVSPRNEKWVKQRVKFEINDRSYMMSDKTQHCDENGKCEDFDPVRLCDFKLEQAKKSLSKPNVFEAATHALDWYGCFLNAKVAEFWNFLRDLFIPALPDLKGPFNQLSDVLSKKLGFLFYPFKWFIQLFQALINATSSCSIDTSQVPGANANGLFWGRPVRLSVCSAERDLPQVYSVSVFFIRIVTVFGLLYSLYHRLVNLLTTDCIVKAAQEGRK